MLKELVKIANDLDLKGLTVEADKLDSIIKKIADDDVGGLVPELGIFYMRYTIVEGDTASELALLGLGDSSKAEKINGGRPLKIGQSIWLPYLKERAGTTRRNPKTGKTLQLDPVIDPDDLGPNQAPWMTQDQRDEIRRMSRNNEENQYGHEGFDLSKAPAAVRKYYGR